MKPRFCEYFWRKLRTRKCFVTDEEFVREGLPCTDRLPLCSAALMYGLWSKQLRTWYTIQHTPAILIAPGTWYLSPLWCRICPQSWSQPVWGGVAHSWFLAGQHGTPPPPQLHWACSWPWSFSLQCETSLEGEPGLCWCVYPWSGKRILGSVAIRGDPKCQQYFNLQNWKQMQYDRIPAHEIFKYIVYLYSEIHTHFYIERCICIYM